jgi:hypothetical protein
MRNFLLLLKFLVLHFYDLLLNLLEQVQLLLLNLQRMLGLNLEEDGDIMEEAVADTEVVVGVVIMVVLTDNMVVIMVVVLGEDITVIMDIMVIRDTKDLLEVLKEVMVVLMVVVEEENGDIMLRNLKNKRCVLLLKLR